MKKPASKKNSTQHCRGMAVHFGGSHPASHGGSFMDYHDILFDKIDGVAWVTINRPEVLNAFRERTLDELIDAIGSVNADPSIGVVVITGAGDRAFSAGGDFTSMMKLNRQNGHLWNNRMIALATTIRGLGVPVIAMVNGWCMGGGNELQLMCDLTIA